MSKRVLVLDILKQSQDPRENMKSPEYENYYDNKFHLEELKMEVPDKEVPNLDCKVKNEIVSEDNELPKFNDQNEIKHETMENGLPLNVTIKTERIEEERILDNNKDMSVSYWLTVQGVQLNSDERLLKNNVNLFKANNEQTNMPRVAELNELNKFKLLHKHKEPPDVAEIIFKCINCNAEFNNRLTLNDHAKLCQKEEEIVAYKCNFSDGVYRSEQNLRNHVRKMPINKQHKYLTNQMKSIHYDYGRTFDWLCGKQFRSPVHSSRYKSQHEHMSLNTDNDRNQCESCQKIFKTKGNLVTHIKRSHYDYGRTFDCSCGKQFRSPVHLKDHKLRQHKRKITDTDNVRFQCDSCQKIFKNRHCLVNHIKRFHYDFGRTFDCWCGKQFRSPILLREHKKQHEHKIKDTDNVRFQCSSCQKFFKNKHRLCIHVKRFH